MFVDVDSQVESNQVSVIQIRVHCEEEEEVMGEEDPDFPYDNSRKIEKRKKLSYTAVFYPIFHKVVLVCALAYVGR